MGNKLFKNLCNEKTLQKAWKIIKEKNAASGIDGFSVTDYEKNIHKNLKKIVEELKDGEWKPEPYLTIEIPKNEKEKRKLGLMCVKDKIIQQSIRLIIEPILEKKFQNNSYAYRQDKGAVKAIHRTMQECNKKVNQWIVRLDIDDYFDNVDHAILSTMLESIISDVEINRLIMLSVKMGVVNKRMKWSEPDKGIKQGAIISPMLANLYLNDFDKFVIGKNVSYVRYADDFIILTETEEQAKQILEETTVFLKDKLNLSLNEPQISRIEDGFDFLGIHVKKHFISLSDKKIVELKDKIKSYAMTPFGLNVEAKKSWKGFANYYALLLPQQTLEVLDNVFSDRIKQIVSVDSYMFKSKESIRKTLEGLTFLSEKYDLEKDRWIEDLLKIFAEKKQEHKAVTPEEQNKKIIKQKKTEYRKKETEGSELIITKPGVFVGLTQKGVTVKEKGEIIHQKPLGNLGHIIITGKGITLSSNLIEHCLKNKISIDFFYNNQHIGSFLSSKFLENTLWRKQAYAKPEKNNRLAMAFISGKTRNQFNLIKYFHKYHKSKFPYLESKYADLSILMDRFEEYKDAEDYKSEDFISKLIGYESLIAMSYWAYIRQLLQDDNVSFEQRIRKGATDIVNSMLNYGYAILYTRAWQALLGAKLNPYESIIHVRQAGKPTFTYDFVEMFRAQVVDRVVISLIQRGVSLECDNGMLDEETKGILAKGILERLGRYEKYRGEEKQLEQIINTQAKEVAAFYEKDVQFKPYISKW